MAQGEYDSADAGVRYTAEELEDMWAKQPDHVKLASRITSKFWSMIEWCNSHLMLTVCLQTMTSAAIFVQPTAFCIDLSRCWWSNNLETSQSGVSHKLCINRERLCDRCFHEEDSTNPVNIAWILHFQCTVYRHFKSAERCINELCGLHDVQFRGNAPCGHFEYKYPPNEEAIGGKVTQTERVLNLTSSNSCVFCRCSSSKPNWRITKLKCCQVRKLKTSSGWLLTAFLRRVIWILTHEKVQDSSYLKCSAV